MDQHLAVLESEELNHGWTRMDTDNASLAGGKIENDAGWHCDRIAGRRPWISTWRCWIVKN